MLSNKKYIFVLAILSSVFCAGFFMTQNSFADQVYVEKGSLAGTFGMGSSNRSFYYYVNGELMMCGDAEYAGFTGYRSYREINDDVAKAIVLVGSGKVGGYSISLPNNQYGYPWNFPRTSEYALLHSILSIHLHNRPGQLTGLIDGGHIGWWDYPFEYYQEKIGGLIGEAYDIYEYVSSNYPSILNSYSLYATNRQAAQEQEIYFVKEANINVDFSSTSRVSNASGTNVTNGKITLNDSDLDADLNATTTVTFSHNISPTDYGDNNAKYTRIETTIDGKRTDTSYESSVSATKSVQVTVPLGLEKKVCQYAYYSPRSITLSPSGSLISRNNNEFYSSACVTVSAKINMKTVKFESTSKATHNGEDISNIRKKLPDDEKNATISFVHTLSPTTYGDKNAHYWKVLTTINDVSVPSNTKELNDNPLQYSDNVGIDIAPGELYHICQYVFYNPTSIAVTETTGTVLNVAESKNAFSSVCTDVYGRDATDEFTPHSEVE